MRRRQSWIVNLRSLSDPPAPEPRRATAQPWPNANPTGALWRLPRNGATSQNNSYLLDGIIDVAPWIDNLVVVPPLDAVQETRLMGSGQQQETAGTFLPFCRDSGRSFFYLRFFPCSWYCEWLLIPSAVRTRLIWLILMLT